MSTIDSVTQTLDGAERFAKRKFFHRETLALILRMTEARMQLRDDFFFLATFVANAAQLLERQGSGVAETENLSREFSTNMENAHELLRTIIKESDEIEKNRVVSGYLALSHDAVANLLALFREIAWIKSFEIEQQGI